MTFVAEDLKTLLTTYNYLTVTHGGVTSTFQKWEKVTIVRGFAERVGTIVDWTTTTATIIIDGDGDNENIDEFLIGLEVITGILSGAALTVSSITQKFKLTHGGVTGTQFVVGEILTSATGTFTITEVSTLYVIGTITTNYMDITGGPNVTGSIGAGTAVLSAYTLSSIPSIRLLYEDNPIAYSPDGQIEINIELLNNNESGQNHRKETYRIEVDVSYDIDNEGTNNPTLLNRLIRQIQHSFDAENRLIIANRTINQNGRPKKDYYWSLIYRWSGTTRLGRAKMFVDVEKRWIPR